MAVTHEALRHLPHTDQISTTFTQPPANHIQYRPPLRTTYQQMNLFTMTNIYSDLTHRCSQASQSQTLIIYHTRPALSTHRNSALSSVCSIRWPLCLNFLQVIDRSLSKSKTTVSSWKCTHHHVEQSHEQAK